MILNSQQPSIAEQLTTLEIQIQGIVQGVGFRPTIWRYAKENNIKGQVVNNADGVAIIAQGLAIDCEQFINLIKNSPPYLARIDILNSDRLESSVYYESFEILKTQDAHTATAISPDVACCKLCLDDVLSPFSKRYRYPLTNCTHCGPRFSIIKAMPYDRKNTSMDDFAMCADCQHEYRDPEDRRFHAQPNCCHQCGPVVELVRLDGKPICIDNLSQLDHIDAACTLLQQGEIIAIKGTGGYHLACDATSNDAVLQLRDIKQRIAKPFALMARDLSIVERFVTLSSTQQLLLSSKEAPIVLLERTGLSQLEPVKHFGDKYGAREADLQPLSNAVAPGLKQLGFMLPYSPIHSLLLKRMNRPIVLTSANISGEAQIIDDQQLQEKFTDSIKYVLWHQREIVNRCDDSLVQVSHGETRLLRRSRGYAPMSLPLPAGFESTPDLTAFGSELKNTFCFIKDSKAILSQHIGDLKSSTNLVDYRNTIDLYKTLYQHQPARLAADLHPEYLSTKHAQQTAEQSELPLDHVQHHHAHISACLFDNNQPLDVQPVLGIVLDGLGLGLDGNIWGGEFLLADYTYATRLATFKPVPMIGGEQAVFEPWRNTYAHLMAEMSWAELKINFQELELIQFFEQQPIATFDAMVDRNLNSPLASSCGRLFDAVAAAIGICRERISYEGQAAIELEAVVDIDCIFNEDDSLAYPFSIPLLDKSLPYLEPVAMWQALLGDMVLDTPPSIMAARFHKGLAICIVTMAKKLCTRNEEHYINTIALSGGVFQNKLLLELVTTKLESEHFKILTHRHIPANDGGIAIGQAMTCAAKSILTKRNP